MGKKRKRESSEERINRKIRKLENELRRRKSGLSSSDEERTHRRYTTACETRDLLPGEEPASSSYEVEVPPTLTTPLAPTQPPLAPTPPHLTPSPPPRSPTPPPALDATAGTAEETPTDPPGDVDLDDDILQLLGDAPEPETTFGATVHKDIAARWHNVIKKGLTKDCKENIFKEYLIPLNCELLVPPMLNPEAKAALSDALVKRDASLLSRQKHLSIATTALTHTLDKIVSNKGAEKSYILKSISDACRILCEMHHYETETRKKFIISSTNSNLKDALSNSTTDKFLFGENLSEKLKAAKSVQKSGEELKSVQKTQNQSNSHNIGKNRVNYRTLHQKRPDEGRTAAGPRQQWTLPRSRTAGRAYQPPPPPPPLPHPPPPPPPRRTGRR